MGWFSKKKDEGPAPSTGGEDAGDTTATAAEHPAVSANVEMALTKITSQLEALNEVRKANSEQFTRISEQIGELRGSLMDSNKSIGVIEVAATRAIDLVSSVQPDKLMIEVRRTDGKTEALRANIEANELMMKDIMQEIKGMREHMNFYKGIEQVAKLNEEVKQELVEIKKVEGTLSKHADRVETIFIEVEKKFSDFEKFNQAVKELDRSFKKIAADFDKMRVAVEEKSDRKELVKLVDKFSDFEKHTSNILKLLDQKSRTTITELNGLFDQLKTQLEQKNNIKLAVKPISEGASIVSGSAAPSASGPADSATASVPSTPAPSSDGSSGGSGAASASPPLDAPAKRNIFGFMKK